MQAVQTHFQTPQNAASDQGLHCLHTGFSYKKVGAPVAQWVKCWPTDLADRFRSSLEVKSSLS